MKGWASDLEKSHSATKYELTLLGPTSQGVIDVGMVGAVSVPTPKNLDMDGLVREASHVLGKLLVHRERNSFG